MSDLKPKTFIQLLDEYNSQQSYTYADYLTILQFSQFHYISNKLNTPSYVGNHMSKIPKPSLLFNYNYAGLQGYDPFSPLKPPQDETENFLKYHIPPLLRSDNGQMKPLDIMQPIEEVHIDAKIDTFSDLISLIQKTEYRPYVKYNIDLKALVQVKEELFQLHDMIGMTSFKNSLLNQLLYFIQDLHKGKDHDFMHTVLSGPPGTGKTEVATLLGKIYSKIGVLKNRVFKKATRSDLVAGYLGQTAIKTSKLIQECLGGCLFIDEAYSLGASNNGLPGDTDSYSKECLDTLCEALSSNKDNLMVIIAGYEDELKKTFFSVNQGLESRFIWRFTIDSYSPKELMQIFQKKVQDNGWSICSTTESNTLAKWFEKYSEKFVFYGRDMEALFSYIKIAHGRRIYGKPEEQRKKINDADLDAGYASFLLNKNDKSKERPIPYGLYV